MCMSGRVCLLGGHSLDLMTPLPPQTARAMCLRVGSTSAWAERS